MLTNDELAVMYGKAYMATDSQGASIPHFGRLVEAATLATVTPLVQQMLVDLERWVPRNDITKTTPTIEAARAFLSGATKTGSVTEINGINNLGGATKESNHG